MPTVELYRVTVRFSGRPPPPYPGVHQFETCAYVEAESVAQAERYGIAALRPHYDPKCLCEVIGVARGAFVEAVEEG